MKTLSILATCTIAPIFAFVATVQANPIGTEYAMELTLYRPIENSLPLALERHAGDSIPFDQTTKDGALPLIAPNPHPMKDLDVTDAVFPAGQQEMIAIWLESRPQFVTVGDFPRMFTETVPEEGDMVRFILDDLYWQDFAGEAIVDNLHILASFMSPNPDVYVTPTEVTIGGLGTQASPLAIQADFDAFDFDLDGEGRLDVIDLRISFTVAHVPEPACLALAVMVVLVFVGFPARNRWQ